MAATVFKRKIYGKLLDWKNTRKGQTAILVQGARRIGKSTIVEEFAKNEYKSYILINFANAPKEIINLFEDMSSLNFFFLGIQAHYNVVLHERESVIVFDEVQFNPKARQAIKYLVQDGRYDYIETGSLISIRKNVKDILIPSEETKLNMYPMDFEEFCMATGEDARIAIIKEMASIDRPLGDAVHRVLMRLFRLYMLVGGMPQSVNEYLKTNNLSMVDVVKREILQLYDDDFRKIDDSGRASMIFNSIPAQLNSAATRYLIPSSLEKVRTDRMDEIIADITDSMTVNKINATTDPNIGMAMFADLYKYKMFTADTGLFVSLAFQDKDYVENVIYKKLLSDKLSANLGYVYENVVAQMLVANGHKPFYFTFKKDEEGKHLYEIDFLITKSNKVCPIEVKSSGYKTHRSLDKFSEIYSDRIGKKYIIYAKDYQREGDLVYLPVYMVPFVL